jgi:hypothetical protein
VDVAALGAVADISQHFAAVPLRQIDVENHDGGASRGMVSFQLIKKLDGLFPVFDYTQFRIDIRAVDSCANQVNVSWVVLDNQDSPARAGLLLRPGR